MTVAMAEKRRQPSLGVLEHTVGVEADVGRAIAALAEFGLLEPEPELRNAVAVALMHSSYLYENQTAFPRITRGLLDALSNLGLAFLKRRTTVDSYIRTASSTAESLSKENAETVLALPAWAARQAWLLESAALGRTFADATPPATVSAHLLRRVVGVLCLSDRETVASGLLAGLLADVRRQRDATVGDPKTALQEAIAPGRVEYFYKREGPDHETVFRATVRDTRGRRGTGAGRSKKLAAQNAALDFLRSHIPQALSPRMPKSAQRPVPVAISAPPAHIQAVRQLRNLFGLPESATPLLSQALVHTSWTYERRVGSTANRQPDNEVLAFVGAEAAIYEDALAATRQVAADPPQEFAFRSLDNDAYHDVFRRTGLASGLLLGTGQASKGISVEMAATAFQAIVGAVFVAKSFPQSLATCWPEAWAPIWQVIVQATPRLADPTTLLQEAASAMRLQTEYEFRCSGPDHANLYQATVVLISESLGIRTQTIGSPTAGKTRAKHEVSAAVMHTLNQLAVPASTQKLTEEAPDEMGLARFILAHQVALISTSPVPLQRWVAKRLFGLHLAPSPAQLISWAEGADQILDSRNTIKAAGPCLEETFRTVLDTAWQHADAIRIHLSRTLQALEQINVPEDLSRECLDQLLHLSGVYRCIGADDPDIDLTALADEWHILYQGRLAISSVPAVRLTGRERAILDTAIAAILPHGATAVAEIADAKVLRVRIIRTTGPAPQESTIAEICALWSQVTRTASLSPVDQGIEVIISTTESRTDPGPITAAALAALRPKPEPYQASVADILHDLKNQAVAVRQAVAQPAENETARLEQQLDARLHLERTHAMVLQLKAATSLIQPGTDENVSVQLGAFLRHYGRTAFAWLPDNIALSAPGASHPAYVAIDDRALTAILDNLVKNAFEAMPHGGSIKLGWAADKYEAIIEVADDGPGLPPGIARALASGQRIHSTKPGGNGLGLLSVRTLLRRVGGQLGTTPVSSGTAWEITLPIAISPAAEDS
jgi:dsRNA-specific ribonuclease